MWASPHTNLVPTSNQRNNVDHSLIIKHHYIITKSSVPVVFWIMCLVLKEVYVSGAHDIGPALRRRFVWFDSYVPSTIFQLCRDGSGIFFGVLRGRNSAPFPMGFRWLFSQFEKKIPNLKKKKKKKFFTKLAITHTIAIKLNENRMQF